eukprot:142598-Hanusia_phi.AAC.3
MYAPNCKIGITIIASLSHPHPDILSSPPPPPPHHHHHHYPHLYNPQLDFHHPQLDFQHHSTINPITIISSLSSLSVTITTSHLPESIGASKSSCRSLA